MGRIRTLLLPCKWGELRGNLLSEKREVTEATMPLTSKTSIASDHHSALAEHLREVQPSLIARVEPQRDLRFKITPFIVEVETANDDVIDQGYDPHHSPLGCPVYWRIVKARGWLLLLQHFPSATRLRPKGLGHTRPTLLRSRLGKRCRPD
jgi:hypothetical protein